MKQIKVNAGMVYAWVCMYVGRCWAGVYKITVTERSGG